MEKQHWEEQLDRFFFNDGGVTKKAIKYLVEDALHSERQTLIEEIEKMKRKYTEQRHHYLIDGYNDALSDIISLLKKEV